MTIPRIRNAAASVRQRVLNYAQTNRRPFAEVLQYYAMERFLYRLSVSPDSERFLLKGREPETNRRQRALPVRNHQIAKDFPVTVRLLLPRCKVTIYNLLPTWEVGLSLPPFIDEESLLN